MKTAAGILVSPSLAGRTLRWRFDEGPTAGKVYEHVFRPDGTVVWREIRPGGNGNGKSEGPGTRYASFEVAPETHMISYLSESGYTLTVVLDLESKKCWGVASNAKEWYPLSGTIEAAR